MKQMIQMDIKALKTLTGRRPTSWPFTSVAEELNLGLLRTTPASGQGRTTRIFCIQHSEKKPAGLISVKVSLICVLFYLFIFLITL